MDDPRSLVRQMQAPYTVSNIDICRDGGTVIFEITDGSGKALTGTLITPFQGTPRRLTLGISGFESPNLLCIRRYAMTPGGPSEAVIYDILRYWHQSVDGVTEPS